MHRAYLMRRQRFAEQVYRAHLSAEHPLLVQLGGCSDIALVEGLQCDVSSCQLALSQTRLIIIIFTYVIRRNVPCHLRAGRQLTIHQTFNLALRPPIIYVHYRDHVPLKQKNTR